MKDNFSTQASSYARFRPAYPESLYEHLLDLVIEKEVAWDCGCGNGQVAGVLSDRFDLVIATDISAEQIKHAVQKPNISYRLLSAEQTDINDSSVNLVTVAQAIHWFNFDEFYTEVRRVSKPDAILAVWCYNLLEISPALDLVIKDLYENILGDEYWDPERRLIENHYKTITFPFEELPFPDFHIEAFWSIDQLTGYLNSWSAVQHYIRKNGVNPIEELNSRLNDSWGNEKIRRVSFPIYGRIGKVKP